MTEKLKTTHIYTLSVSLPLRPAGVRGCSCAFPSFSEPATSGTPKSTGSLQRRKPTPGNHRPQQLTQTRALLPLTTEIILGTVSVLFSLKCSSLTVLQVQESHDNAHGEARDNTARPQWKLPDSSGTKYAAPDVCLTELMPQCE